MAYHASYQQPETKWQRIWRLMKKWHFIWVPLAIVILDRLLIMWPYIPIGEATFYMKAQALATFDESLWWVIHVAETIVLTYLWLFIVSAHMYITVLVIVKLNKLWKEDKYQRQLEKTAIKAAHEAIAQDQVRILIKMMHKQAKQDKFLISDAPFGQYMVQYVPRREYREQKKTMPSFRLPLIDDIAVTYQELMERSFLFQLIVAKGMEFVEKKILPDPDHSKRRKAMEEVMQYFATPQPPARARGLGRLEAAEVKVLPAGIGPTAETTRTAGGGDGGLQASSDSPQASSAAHPAAMLQGAESKGPEERQPAAATVGSGQPAAPAASEPQKDEPGAACQGGEKPAVVSEPPVSAEEKREEPMGVANQVMSADVESGVQAGAVAGPIQEQSGAGLSTVEAAVPVGQAAVQPQAKISVERALEIIKNTIEPKNEVRRIAGKPPLTAAEEEAIRQTIFSQVDPEELAAWRAGQEAPASAASEEPEEGRRAAVGTEQAAHQAEEEGGLVGVGADDRDEEEPEWDEDDEGEEDEQVSPERWLEVLGQAEGNPLVAAVMLLMENRDEWRGSPSELLAMLNLRAPAAVQKGKGWPQNNKWLTRQLIDDMQLIKQKGIEINYGRNKRQRNLHINKR